MNNNQQCVFDENINKYMQLVETFTKVRVLATRVILYGILALIYGVATERLNLWLELDLLNILYIILMTFGITSVSIGSIAHVMTTVVRRKILS